MPVSMVQANQVTDIEFLKSKFKSMVVTEEQYKTTAEDYSFVLHSRLELSDLLADKSATLEEVTLEEGSQHKDLKKSTISQVLDWELRFNPIVEGELEQDLEIEISSISSDLEQFLPKDVLSISSHQSEQEIDVQEINVQETKEDAIKEVSSSSPVCEETEQGPIDGVDFVPAVHLVESVQKVSSISSVPEGELDEKPIDEISIKERSSGSEERVKISCLTSSRVDSHLLSGPAMFGGKPQAAQKDPVSKLPKSVGCSVSRLPEDSSVQRRSQGGQLPARASLKTCHRAAPQQRPQQLEALKLSEPRQVTALSGAERVAAVRAEAMLRQRGGGKK